jgi:hypothetical protein
MHVLRAASIAHTTQLIRFGDLGWRDPGSAGTIVLCQVVYKELRRGSATFLLLPAGNANLLAWLNGGNLSGEGVGLLVAPIPELEPVGAGDGASAEGVVAMVNREVNAEADRSGASGNDTDFDCLCVASGNAANATATRLGRCRQSRGRQQGVKSELAEEVACCHIESRFE